MRVAFGGGARCIWRGCALHWGGGARPRIGGGGAHCIEGCTFSFGRGWAAFEGVHPATEEGCPTLQLEGLHCAIVDGATLQLVRGVHPSTEGFAQCIGGGASDAIGGGAPCKLEGCNPCQIGGVHPAIGGCTVQLEGGTCNWKGAPCQFQEVVGGGDGGDEEVGAHTHLGERVEFITSGRGRREGTEGWSFGRHI